VASYILARQIFRKVILLDKSRILTRWPKSGAANAVLRKMFNVADKLINNWEDFKAEFAKSTTLGHKAMLVSIMYVPWELCDDTFARWNKDNPFAWPDPKTLRCATTRTRTIYMYVFVYVYDHSNKYMYTHTSILI